jgi:FlaA1/EpsC-like NDP-sugar epimerase
MVLGLEKTMTDLIKERSFLVTGAAGTIGREVVRQLLSTSATEVIALDNNEGELSALGELYRKDRRLQVILGDIREFNVLKDLTKDIDYVVHAAALKHVPLCETAPMQSVETNIRGVQNVIDASLENQVKKVVFTSSDKAVNPTNVMGVSKLMGERLMTAAHARRSGDRGTKYSSVRFGNVAGSRGSVIPLFCQQIARGGPITITDKDMTRFVMTIEHSVRLVFESMSLSAGGEVFITKMPALRVQDLAEVMIDMIAPVYGHNPKQIDIEYIGARPGEKMYEELMTGEEVPRTWELNDLFVLLPSYWDLYDQSKYEYARKDGRKTNDRYYSNEVQLMDKAAIRDFLFHPTVFPDDVMKLLSKLDLPDFKRSSK